jgi:hypothetical protein
MPKLALTFRFLWTILRVEALVDPQGLATAFTFFTHYQSISLN